MRRYYFSVANVKIVVETDEQLDVTPYSEFVIADQVEPDILIETSDFLPENDDENKIFEESIRDRTLIWYKKENDGFLMRVKYGDEEKFYLDANKDFSHIKIMKIDEERDFSSMVFNAVGETIFKNYLCTRRGVILHAVAINWNNQGILFSGTSGTGKTTQADLWSRYKGSYIVNGDKPNLLITDSGVLAYGSIWSGSSEIYKNEHVKANAVIFIEQHQENKIRRLTQPQASIQMMRRCVMPFFAPDLVDITMETIEEITDSVPMFLLQCRPDEEAVNVAYDELIKNNYIHE